eukprot:GHUV01058272.1.p1 GENE.GHUV01058272.1~~GHUV01058272.1.p1  ORF type:complete len:142 (-),score=27.33 GHUV01058272.1:466-891(-)
MLRTAQGVQVGDWWKDRLDCRQWGAHFPHVAGIAGQSSRGAQSVVLSGGYEDDHDEGEWFLYTGSGGRDLSGNKRTNKVSPVATRLLQPSQTNIHRLKPVTATFDHMRWLCHTCSCAATQRAVCHTAEPTTDSPKSPVGFT